MSLFFFKVLKLQCSRLASWTVGLFPYSWLFWLTLLKKADCNSAVELVIIDLLFYLLCLPSRCFGMLLSPGQKVCNSDMHLLDMVSRIHYQITYQPFILQLTDLQNNNLLTHLLLAKYCNFSKNLKSVALYSIWKDRRFSQAHKPCIVTYTGINGEELWWEGLCDHRNMEPQHAGLSTTEWRHT